MPCNFFTDGASSIADHARRAARLGLAGVGFCEHVDLDPDFHDFGWRNVQIG